MNIVDHKRASPKLPGVSRSMKTKPTRVPTRASVILFACAALAGIAGFYLPALFVIAVFLAFVGMILLFCKPDTNIKFTSASEPSVFERELIAGSPEWQIRQIREGSY